MDSHIISFHLIASQFISFIVLTENLFGIAKALRNNRRALSLCLKNQRGLRLAEFILAYAAQRADIIVGKILERYAAVLLGVIDIAADIAYILFHSVFSLRFYRNL